MWKNSRLVVCTGLLVAATTTILNAGDYQDTGIVRIADGNAMIAPIPNDQSSATTYSNGYANHQGVVWEGPGYRMTGNPVADWWTTKRMKRHAKRERRRCEARARFAAEGGGRCNNGDCLSEAAGKRLEQLRCRYGYFIPTGCGGGGCAHLGNYNLLYAANPQYFDQRDGQLYSAQGYGVPMAVPLAPNVANTYNYGWGIPSSRITPISRVVP
jgi:hypothetical protein